MTKHQTPFLKLVYSRPEPGIERRKSALDRGTAAGPGDEPGHNPHFKHWVEEYLQGTYSDILKEPIPDEIINIVKNKSEKI